MRSLIRSAVVASHNASRVASRVASRLALGAVALGAALAVAPHAAHAQLADTKVLTVAAVKNILAASEAAAKAGNWNMSIAVVDAGGDLVGFLKMDGASQGTVQIAQGKARTAARFGRPTKVYADRIASDTLNFLSIDGLVALQGGVPITINGRVIGAVGVSGATSAQDEQVAMTGIAAIKP